MTDIEVGAMPGPKITIRRQGPNDPCWVRDQWLVSREEQHALRQPVTRRLLVDGVGHYFDEHHGHVAVAPNGARYTAVFLCVRGTGWLQIGDTRHKVLPDSALLIPAGVPHSYGPIDLPWSIYWCTLMGSDVIELLQAIGVPAKEPILRIGDPARLIDLIDEMALVYEREDSPSLVLEAAGIAWKLMTRLSAERVMSTRADPLERALDYLTEHFHEWVRVPDLAKRVGLSQARLNKLFQAATGRSVLAYQIDLRMAQARRLLEQTDASISDIAREIGYTDPYYFSRHFRQVNGVNPTQFRQERVLAR